MLDILEANAETFKQIVSFIHMVLLKVLANSTSFEIAF